jgi:hypothetical protein
VEDGKRRIARIDRDNGCSHAMNRGVNRQVVFFLDPHQVVEVFGGASLEFDRFMRDDLRGALVLPRTEQRRARQRGCDDSRLGSALHRAIRLFSGHNVSDTV